MKIKNECVTVSGAGSGKEDVATKVAIIITTRLLPTRHYCILTNNAKP